MASRSAPAILVLLIACVPSPACRATDHAPVVVQPGAPGEDSRVVTQPELADPPVPTHTDADVSFMQGMIHHHAQALDMVELLKTRTRSEAMRKLAERIELSQRDEIQMMREWLKDRGADVPGEHAHHAPGAPMMPGMLTPQEMKRLAAAKGVEFDRLFLAYMIKHHEGALVMVKELFAAPGAGQEAEIFAFASDVDADQLIEIRRMDRMLKELQK
jgi:uncharacterized protein (DUF305 family)